MSNNYRNFLLSPVHQQQQQQKQQQQSAAESKLAQHYSARSETMEDCRRPSAATPARHRLAQATSGPQVDCKRQSQVANYCPSQFEEHHQQPQLCRIGAGNASNLAHRYTSLADANQLSAAAIDHQSAQAAYATSASGAKSAVGQGKWGANMVGADQDGGAFARRREERQQQLESKRQCNWPPSNCANTGIEYVQQLRSAQAVQLQNNLQAKQRQPTSSSSTNNNNNNNNKSSSNNNNNNNNNNCSKSSDSQEFISCDGMTHGGGGGGGLLHERTGAQPIGGAPSPQLCNRQGATNNSEQQVEEEFKLAEKMAQLFNGGQSTSGGRSQTTAQIADEQREMDPKRAPQHFETLNFDEEDDHRYADQIRRNQLNQFNHLINNDNNSIGRQSDRPPAADYQYPSKNQTKQRLAPSGQNNRTISDQRNTGTATGHTRGSSHKETEEQRAVHVNFNRRSSHANASDDEEASESTRKKKYLTAKYGQQQMSLIKKRLKIEMWLHEQLQQLAKQSRLIEPDEVDDIDIDLDQLLDLEDDSARRNELRKILAPLSDLSPDAIDNFIAEVLEQSKLL